MVIGEYAVETVLDGGLRNAARWSQPADKLLNVLDGRPGEDSRTGGARGSNHRPPRWRRNSSGCYGARARATMPTNEMAQARTRFCAGLTRAKLGGIGAGARFDRVRRNWRRQRPYRNGGAACGNHRASPPWTCWMHRWRQISSNWIPTPASTMPRVGADPAACMARHRWRGAEGVRRLEGGAGNETDHHLLNGLAASGWKVQQKDTAYVGAIRQEGVKWCGKSAPRASTQAGTANPPGQGQIGTS